MAPGSPRKAPLSGRPLGPTRSEAGPTPSQGLSGRVTSRAFFCAVVVEGNGDRDLPQGMFTTIAQKVSL